MIFGLKSKRLKDRLNGKNSLKNWRKADIRKEFVALALVLLVAGICLAAYPISESHIEELPVKNWNLNEVLTAYKSSFFAIELEAGSFFELNISASEEVNVNVGTVGYNVWGDVVTTNPILDVRERNIFQRTVGVSKKGHLSSGNNQHRCRICHL